MGARPYDARPRLSPVPSPKDASRRPLRNFGRIDIQEIVPDPDQPRAEFSDEALLRLGQSIQAKGQLAPIRVRWNDDLEKWFIIVGERRWRAARQAGLATIECYFHEGELSRADVLEQQLIENLLREDLKPVEEASAFVTLMELNGWNGKQVAQELRVPASKVSRALALLQLPQEIQQRVDSGELPARSAYELSKLSDENQQRELVEQAVAGKLTHDQAARAVRQRRGKRCEDSRGIKLTFLSESGWKVTVAANKQGTYHDVEQALQEALDEVRHRIENNVQLF